MADAAEAVAAGADVGLQHRLDPAAQRQIGMADDAGAMPGLAVDAAGAHGGDAVDELGLADGPHLVRARRRACIARACTKTVATMLWPLLRVGQQLVEQVAPAGPVPQVVVRIDDRQIGLEDRLLAPIEPFLADGEIVGGRRRGGGRRG